MAVFGMLGREIYHPDDGSKVLGNVGLYLPDCKAQHLRSHLLYSSP
jgi:hypothetical protein